MATRVIQGDNSAYRVETDLSLSREQVKAISDIYNQEIQYLTVQREMIQQLADAGYNQDTIDEYINNPALVSEASSMFSSAKMQTIDPRLFNAVQQCLLNHDIIRFVQPNDEESQPDKRKKRERQPKPDKHANRANWDDTIFD